MKTEKLVWEPKPWSCVLSVALAINKHMLIACATDRTQLQSFSSETTEKHNSRNQIFGDKKINNHKFISVPYYINFWHDDSHCNKNFKCWNMKSTRLRKHGLGFSCVSWSISVITKGYRDPDLVDFLEVPKMFQNILEYVCKPSLAILE